MYYMTGFEWQEFVAMHDYTVSVGTAAGHQLVEKRLREFASGGPFRISELAPVGVGAWVFRLQPARPEMVIGFGKVAEFLVLLAREFDVHAVGRAPSRSVAAAS